MVRLGLGSKKRKGVSLCRPTHHRRVRVTSLLVVPSPNPNPAGAADWGGRTHAGAPQGAVR